MHYQSAFVTPSDQAVDCSPQYYVLWETKLYLATNSSYGVVIYY